MMDEARLHSDEMMTQPSGPIVRPYALTGGRTRGRATDLPIEAQVVAVPGAIGRTSHLLPEARAIVELCIVAQSIAEIAALTTVPLGVARVLVSDLSDDGLLDVYGGHAISSSGYTQEELAAADTGERSSNDILLLERVLHGLRDL